MVAAISTKTLYEKGKKIYPLLYLTAQTRLGVKINKLPDLPRAKTIKVRKRGIIGKVSVWHGEMEIRVNYRRQMRQCISQNIGKTEVNTPGGRMDLKTNKIKKP